MLWWLCWLRFLWSLRWQFRMTHIQDIWYMMIYVLCFIICLWYDMICLILIYDDHDDISYMMYDIWYMMIQVTWWWFILLNMFNLYADVDARSMTPSRNTRSYTLRSVPSSPGRSFLNLLQAFSVFCCKLGFVVRFNIDIKNMG